MLGRYLRSIPARAARTALTVATALLLLVSATGCSQTAPPSSPAASQTDAATGQPPAGETSPTAGVSQNPPQAAPPPASTLVPDPCAALTSVDAVLELWGDFTPRLVAAPGDCHYAAGTGRITLSAEGIAAPTEAAAVQALEVSGSRLEGPVTATRVGPDGPWNLYATLPDGPAGQQINIRLTRTPGETPVTATLLRQTPPTATVTIQGGDGAWTPLEPGASFASGPKRLRLQTRGIAAADLLITAYTTNWQPIEPDAKTALADDLIELVFNNPPPLVQLVLGGVSKPDGLYVPEPNRHFYIGEPPALVAITPASGKAERLGPAPPEVFQTAVRPDGRYAALVSLPQTQMIGVQYWLADLKAGTLTPTPFAAATWGFPAFDARGRLIAPLGRGPIGVLDPATGQALLQDSSATEWSRLSPDGRYIAGRAGAERAGSTGAWVGPPRTGSIVIRDLMTDTERLVPWQGYSTGPLWLPDGGLVAPARQSNREPSLGGGPEVQDRWYLLDTRTGDRTPYTAAEPAPSPPEPPAQGYRTTHPDDRFLAMLPDGRALVIRWANWKNQRVPAGP